MSKHYLRTVSFAEKCYEFIAVFPADKSIMIIIKIIMIMIIIYNIDNKPTKVAIKHERQLQFYMQLGQL